MCVYVSASVCTYHIYNKNVTLSKNSLLNADRKKHDFPLKFRYWSIKVQNIKGVLYVNWRGRSWSLIFIHCFLFENCNLYITIMFITRMFLKISNILRIDSCMLFNQQCSPTQEGHMKALLLLWFADSGISTKQRVLCHFSAFSG